MNELLYVCITDKAEYIYLSIILSMFVAWQILNIDPWQSVSRLDYSCLESDFVHSHICFMYNVHLLCIMFKIIAFSIIKLFAQLYVTVGILVTCANDSIISLRGEVWAHKTSLVLTLPLVTEVPVPSQGVRGIDFASFYNFLLDFLTVPTVSLCGIFCFSF